MPSFADPSRVKERAAVSEDDVETDDLDELIDALNEQASGTISDFCGRDFTETTETIEIDGNGHDSIRLPGYPVVDVESVSIGGDEIDADTYRITRPPGRDADENSGILERKAYLWPEGWENLEISYTWGYEEPPQTVVQIAEELVVDALRAAAANKKGAKSGVQSYSMDGFSVSFDESLTSLVGQLTPEQKEQLQEYKRVPIA